MPSLKIGGSNANNGSGKSQTSVNIPRQPQENIVQQSQQIPSQQHPAHNQMPTQQDITPQDTQYSYEQGVRQGYNQPFQQDYYNNPYQEQQLPYNQQDSSYEEQEPVSAPKPINTDEDSEEEEASSAKKSRKDKRKRQKENKRKDKKTKKKSNDSSDDEPLSVDKSYAAFRRRKIATLTTIIVAIVLITGFNVYNTFFKHYLTAQEAATYTNNYNSQKANQKWDSGIQSYLQANLQSLLSSKFESIGNNKDFSVSNISIERNVPTTDDLFMTFFSADITSAGQTDRTFFTIFISTADDKMAAVSEPEISQREPYSSRDSESEIEETDYIALDDREINQEASKEFQTTLQNFLTLGYNSKQDVSSIYKGKTKIEFNGTFKQIDSCSVYDTANKLGFNAKATYIIQLDSGATFENTTYYKVSKNNSGSYIIESIM